MIKEGEMIMIKEDIRMQKFAELIIRLGVNIQTGQQLAINCSIDCAPFARILTRVAYQNKASNVIVNWSDGEINKEYYLHATESVLGEVPDYVVDRYRYFVDHNVAIISIGSPEPGLLKDVDGARLQLGNRALSQKIGFYHKHISNSGSQWVVVSYPNKAWAQKVFPKLTTEEAIVKLWDAILNACYVTKDNDPLAIWEKHNAELAKHNDLLNNYNFKELHFQNSLGTNLHVPLVKNHIWGGGDELAQNGVRFSPNIPTEETFTMPERTGVFGKVVSTKPLNYQGKLVEDFYLCFEQGKVVAYDAKKGKDALTNLLSVDEGSSYLGEVALISDNSPISQMNILFYNTLFDENASCHLALGNAYAMNVKGGIQMSDEELKKAGANISLVHVDFMFGSADMSVTGITQDGQEIAVFKNGNFVF